MTYCQSTVSTFFLVFRVIFAEPILSVPVKYEQVVFCGLSPLQLSLYRLFISSPEIKKLLRGTGSQPLKAIGILKKLCNHPELLDLPGDLAGCDHLIPEGFSGAGDKGGNSVFSGRDRSAGRNVNCEWSGKFVVLERFVMVTNTQHLSDENLQISCQDPQRNKRQSSPD